MNVFTTQDYAARLLSNDDEAELQALLERCLDYYELVEGAPPGRSAASSLLNVGPPGTGPENKLVIGLFTSAGELKGVLDVIRDFPIMGEWYIGLLLLEPSQRGQGAGAGLYGAFEAWAFGCGATAVRLGVVKQNVRAFRFWSGLGFQQIEIRPPKRFGQKESAILVMRKEVSQQI